MEEAYMSPQALVRSYPRLFNPPVNPGSVVVNSNTGKAKFTIFSVSPYNRDQGS